MTDTSLIRGHELIHTTEHDLRYLSLRAPGSPLVWIPRLLLPPAES